MIAAASVVVLACGELAQPATRLASVPLALSVQWPQGTMANAVFGTDIDSVDVTVSRPNESLAASAVVPFPAGQEQLRFTIDVPLQQDVETLYVYLQMRAGPTTLFYGSGEAIVRRGTVPFMPVLPLNYGGPGYDAAFVTISPRPATAPLVVPAGATLQFSAVVQNSFQAVVTPPLGWSVSDTRLGSIDASGRFTAKSLAGSLFVRVATPTGVTDSVAVTIPVP